MPLQALAQPRYIWGHQIMPQQSIHHSGTHIGWRSFGRGHRRQIALKHRQVQTGWSGKVYMSNIVDASIPLK
jgi:hypothetical protein